MGVRLRRNCIRERERLDRHGEARSLFGRHACPHLVAQLAEVDHEREARGTTAPKALKDRPSIPAARRRGRRS